MISSTPVTWSNGFVIHRIDEPIANDFIEIFAQYAGIQKQRAGKTTRYQFPGPNPVSIERADYPKFRAQPYHITEKTDGIRAMLCVTEWKGVHVACLFDRTLTPHLFPIHHMPRALYQGTVFDGEIVYDAVDTQWVFLIFDAIATAGVPVFHLPFTQRLQAIATSLTHYTPTPSDQGLMRVKTFLPCVREVEPAFRAHVEAVGQRYNTDGVIFMPELDRVIYGRHDTLMKLKTHHSIDFLVKNGRLHIYDETAKRNKVIGTPTGPNAHLATEGAIVECVVDPASKKHELWTVVGVRTDKTTSNNKFTFEKTLVNIEEALTLSDVLYGAYETSAHGNPVWT